MDIPNADYKKDRDKGRLPAEEEDGWVLLNCSLFDLLALYLWFFSVNLRLMSVVSHKLVIMLTKRLGVSKE